MSQFIHLHTHSHFSLLDGLAKIDQLLQKARECNMPALALTDHGVMYGIIEFYQKARAAGIKPLIGLEIYLSPRKMTDKQPKVDSNAYHLVLLAKNLAGYHNLLKITTAAHLQGYYYKPRVDKEFLSHHSEGLIALSSCLHGEVPRALVSGNFAKAEEAAREYQKIFGKDNFYLELQHHPNLPEQKIANEGIRALASKIGAPVVATNDIHYLNPDDAQAQEVLLCIQTGKTYDEKNRLSMAGEDFSFRDSSQMIRDFQDIPEAIENTLKIASECNVELELGQFIFPRLKLPGNISAEKYLEKWCWQNLPQKYPQASEEIKKRLQNELEVIARTGFANYMLVVADYANFAKKKGIFTNTRGSAAGSIVSYLLGITNIDPVKYGLLFERFLNPERVSWPDVDLDIADTRRDELIQYVSNKYGKENVAQIITFGTIAARNGIRDTGRVLGMPYAQVDQIAKLIPFNASLEEALESVPELKQRYIQEPEIKQLFDLARKLEGVARHASVHAAGVVIADKPLVNYVPLQISTRGGNSIITQYEMHSLEAVGLVKMDFLGLANLTIIENTLKIIEKTKNRKLKVEDIPLDDPKTYELLSAGKTSGVFQLESEGMKKYLKELRPTNINDVMAMVALYRPGPMELISDYIAGKHGKKAVVYLHPKLKPILEETYGVAVYQEQVLKIAQEICGFSLGEADILRKAIGKKIKKLLLEQREKWVKGAVSRGISQKIAEKLFEFVEPFARYGFNKAHAASYAMIAYQTAYLKTHYPGEFMAAWLTSEEGRDIDKVAFALAEAKNMGLTVLPPDVNESFVDFGVIKETGQISYSLASIKNVGRGAAEKIVEERKKNGKFRSLDDFLSRCDPMVLNKKVLESLARAGALDKLAERNQILAGMEIILKFIQNQNKKRASAQLGLFGQKQSESTSIVNFLPKVPPADKNQRLLWEKELLGMYISEHPLSEYQELWDSDKVMKISSLSLFSQEDIVCVAGVVNKIQRIRTRKESEMAFVTLEDFSGQIEVVVFPKVYEKYAHLLYKDAIVVVIGRAGEKEGVVKILAEKIQNINDVMRVKKAVAANNQSPKQKKLYLTLSNDHRKETLNAIKAIIEAHPGEAEVILRLPYNGQYKEVRIKQRITISPELLAALSKLIGKENLKEKG